MFLNENLTREIYLNIFQEAINSLITEEVESAVTRLLMKSSFTFSKALPEPLALRQSSRFAQQQISYRGEYKGDGQQSGVFGQLALPRMTFSFGAI